MAFPLRALDASQRHVVFASFLGWTLDAFDFFLLVFVLGNIATDFHGHKTEVTLGILLTLAARPIGALLFGRLADRSGGNYTLIMASWMAVVAVLLALLAWLGPEVRGVRFGKAGS